MAHDPMDRVRQNDSKTPDNAVMSTILIFCGSVLDVIFTVLSFDNVWARYRAGARGLQLHYGHGVTALASL